MPGDQYKIISNIPRAEVLKTSAFDSFFLAQIFLTTYRRQCSLNPISETPVFENFCRSLVKNGSVIEDVCFAMHVGLLLIGYIDIQLNFEYQDSLGLMCKWSG